MAGLLEALLRNESGGRNIPNVTQGTSSGQAQRYFQITTGTWNEFGGRQYAPTPLQANYAQQAAVASRIPLRRWDESTVALMRSTGKPIDVNRTLGENLAANGENIAVAPRISGPVEAAGGGGGSDAGVPQLYTAPKQNLPDDLFAPSEEASYIDVPRRSLLADDLSQSVAVGGRDSGGIGNPPSDAIEPQTPLILDFAKATPEPEPEMPVETDALETPQLADLFKVKTIGGTRLANPYTGQALIPSHRRQYG